MPISRDQIRDLLGQGLANEVVAAAVGCSASYITQLLADEEFNAEVTALRVTKLSRENKRDDRLGDLEDKLIDNLEMAINNRMIHKPHDVLRSFQVINNAKRRGVTGGIGDQRLNGGVVNLTLPVVVVNSVTVKTNSTNEVIEIDGKSLLTIAPEKLVAQLKEQTGNETQQATYQKLLGRMPSAIDRNGNTIE